MSSLNGQRKGARIAGTNIGSRKRVLLVLISAQLLFSLLLLSEIASYYVVGYANIPWDLVEIYEIIEVVSAFSGIAISISLILMLTRRNDRIELQLQAASGAFHALMREQFSRWALTDSETEVALFTIKGMSNSEIAQLRGTSEGTIKAQSNAIFRKAGVKNRAQLLGLFVEDLIGGSIMPNVGGARKD
jgi:DNA-binding CsgD family transcriptional regulator